MKKNYEARHIFLGIACSIFILNLTGCSSVDSGKEELNPNESTKITIETDDVVYEHSGFYQVDSMEELMGSEYIVKGKVLDILGPFETTDLVSPLSEKYDDYFKFHTDIIIEVDEYLGNELPFKEIVVRREGGKIDDKVHLTEFENVSIGDEVIIFNLDHDPERHTQIPEGYETNQYFVLLMNTTLKKDTNNRFVRLDGAVKFDGKEKFTLDEIKNMKSKK